MLLVPVSYLNTKHPRQVAVFKIVVRYSLIMFPAKSSGSFSSRRAPAPLAAAPPLIAQGCKPAI